MSIARDGNGALVYLRSDAGAPHVFVSLLRNGVFQAPQRIDAGLTAASSQPVVAAVNGGVTQIAFVNAGTLYTVGSANLLQPLSAPAALAAGAANPAISMSTAGKGYLAFTQTGQGGHDVRAAALIAGGWNLAPSVLDANPADDAGAGTARPAVVTAGDGTAIVAWGESGHIEVRRVLGTGASPTVLQADPTVYGGYGEVSADLPVVGAGGDSSYATVAFHETLAQGSGRQSRVLVNRLHASRFDGVSPADGQSTPGMAGAIDPALGITEYGYGLIVASGDTDRNLFATAVNGNDQPGGSSQINTLSQVSDPRAVVGVAGTVSTLVAWQQDTGGDRPGDPYPLRARRHRPQRRAGRLDPGPGGHGGRAGSGGRRRRLRGCGGRLGPGFRRPDADRRRAAVPGPARVRAGDRVRLRPHHAAAAGLVGGRGAVGTGQLHRQVRRDRHRRYAGDRLRAPFAAAAGPPRVAGLGDQPGRSQRR